MEIEWKWNVRHQVEVERLQQWKLNDKPTQAPTPTERNQHARFNCRRWATATDTSATGPTEWTSPKQPSKRPKTENKSNPPRLANGPKKKDQTSPQEKTNKESNETT
jgi:hypothetical protein